MRRSAMLGLVMVAATALAGCTSTTGSQGTSASPLSPGASMVSPVLASASSSSAASLGALTSPSTPSPSASVSTAVTSSTATSAPSKTTLTTTSVTSATSKSGTTVKSSTAVSSRTTATSRPAASVPTVQTSGLSAKEIADRTAIQGVWLKYWQVTIPILTIPADKREAVLKSVAVEPQVGQLLAAAKKFEKNGWNNYGTPVHRFYWGPPVAGEAQAIMGDCMDLSHVGRLDVKTHKELTVGLVRSNFRGIFERRSDGWRVSGLQILRDTPC